MNNCTLLQTTNSFLGRKSFSAADTSVIDVTPSAVQTALPVVTAKSSVPALRAPNKLAFLDVKPKARRASKKSAAQSFVELMLAAASLLFLAMT